MAQTFNRKTLQSGYSSVDLINENFEAIETALTDVLSRSGVAPNAMAADLDMNSNRILNLPTPVNGAEPATYAQLLNLATSGGLTLTGWAAEEQTATAGQTIFNLSLLSYIPGNNSIRVYINGVRQHSGFSETSASSVTFDTGLQAGDEVLFEAFSVNLSTDAVDSSNVVYNHGGSGALTTNVKAKLQETVSVKDFGATGNGSTDDTAAIQAAIDAISSGTVLFPAGTYNITGITGSSGVHLLGDHGAIIKFITTSDVTTPGVDLRSLNNVSLHNLIFKFDDASATYPDRLIHFGQATNVKIDGCEFYSLKTIATKWGHVIWGDDSVQVEIASNYFHDLAGEVVRIASANRLSIHDNRFETIYRSLHTTGNSASLLNRCILIGSSNEYTINDNIFYNVGKGYNQNTYTFSTCCIDVGNAENGTISGNIARDVYSFIDIETSATDEHVLTVTGNSAEGWLNTTDVTVVSEPYGGECVRYVKSPSSPHRVVISNNVFSGFDDGIRASSIYDSVMTSNVITNMYNYGISAVSVRKCTIANNFIADSSQSGAGNADDIYVVSGTAGFGGGSITGNVMQGTNARYCLYVANNTDATNEQQRWIVANNYSEDKPCFYEAVEGNGLDPRGIREANNEMRPDLTNHALADGSTTLNLYGCNNFATANTSTTVIDTVIMPFGEPKHLIINDNNTDFNFSTGLLDGNGGVDLTSANASDMMIFYRKYRGSVAVGCTYING